MVLIDKLHSEIERYIVYDRKCSATPHNLNCLRYRYRTLVKDMKGMEFNRENFTICVQLMKQRGLSDSTVNNVIKLVKHIDRLYKINELQDYTYFAKSYTPKDVLSAQEIENMANVVINYDRLKDEKNLRYKAVLYTLFFTGARISEVLSLRWDDLKNEGIPLVALNQTKIKEIRYGVIPEHLYDLLLTLPKYSQYIFAVSPDRCLYRETVSEDLKRRAKEVGITKRVYNHIIRHSFINFMLRAGAKMEQVQVMVGHKSIETTQKNYYHTIVGELSQTLYSFHPSLRKMQTLETVEKKAGEVLNTLIDLTRFRYELVVEELIVKR